ncbi:MAG TPA: ABC transporter substrate-binding protein [Baekduia sp.]|uniref:ABC transporter substrate-binding protein n=1 Tax=Baekduia sp. TaxID=2600305 RepID=UPI002D78BD7E|nr:ABC transporter substrate-binding protein [Baekduia sp.]HET6509035.1 ABC transporter substrate-binding protein [Baekduia sp.]
MSVAATAALAISACGGSSSNSSGDKAAAATTASSSTKTTAAQKPTGTPIKILVDSGVGSPLGSFPGVWATAQVAADNINNAGGVNGQPIEIVQCNNRIEPNSAAKCGRQAVKEQVTAVTGQDVYTPAIYPALQKAGIPAMYMSITAPDIEVPISHPISGGGAAELFGVPHAAAKAGAKSIAFLTIQIPGFDVVQKNAIAEAEKIGLKVVKTIPVSPTSTSFAAPVQQARSSGADAVALLVAAPQIAGILQAAQQQGYKPKWAGDAGTFNTEQLQAASKLAPDNLFLVSSMPPSGAGDQFDGIKRFNAQMDAAAAAGNKDAGASERYENVVVTWATVYAIAEIGKSIKGEINAKSLTQALESPDTVAEVPGLLTFKPGAAGDAKYPALKDNGPLYVGQVKDGQLQVDKQTVASTEGVTLQ